MRFLERLIVQKNKPEQQMPMNTWMVPKNKRTLSHIPGTLTAFVAVNEGKGWAGNREMQSRFEKLLERAGYKGGGQQYDPNSGGARTYEAQLSALGLIFKDNTDGTECFRTTLAGQAIIDGANPVDILQHQLLKFQYPSPYSLRQNVNINPDFKIRPFLFVLRLLLDNEIKFLDHKEIALFLLPYAKNEKDLNSIKKSILKYRADGHSYQYPDTFMKDTSSARTTRHTLEQRLNYLMDKVNIFVNYLESCQFIVRPNKSTIEIDSDGAVIVQNFLNSNKPLIDSPDDQLRFQRRYGIDPDHTKDTRKFDAKNPISEENVSERWIMAKFFDLASESLYPEINSELIDKLHESVGYRKEKIREVLEKKRPDSLVYFEENYINMAHQGQKNAIAFETATKEIFSKILGYKAKHVGQSKPVGRAGGNPDVIIISKSDCYCGILDSKAYNSYSIANDHKNRMLYNYIPNISEHSEGTELKFFAYISGNFSSSFSTSIKKLVAETSDYESKRIHGSGITAKNLIRLCQRAKKETISHSALKDLFSCDSIITTAEIEAIA